MEKMIDLNGKSYSVVPEVRTIQQLLEHLGLGDRILIVEKNKEILQKEYYDAPIMDRDQIEIIHFVGGG
ncbi:thiamine biosynthesis protein ThiS [Sporosarcina sp. P21c]|uniref:sulfur carrier protein ThiS n=1 Tax=Sporosarcina TaxID=1569 RepID=UPI000A1696DE|nr:MULTISPECIES: sulfur carrier protein ThiS [Sporosarcina]ARJ39261.1 thiamine biosynthesis protein ThiS [Sporosarcina ureae]PIC67518.1 thiamine biosynthesis protein ThiS [Sporosarcina sp. P16a]PIC82555.1 thiamine biosynthesis protein ThiS [Sporosarcina sp. P1]PIC89155.1 thiamine biosynthesis protein ThiS [Sporosarcina sp. P21c]PIC92969.1 thiamine biosynthesis protein ThiS [Sporosarcina sp. P25]